MVFHTNPKRKRGPTSLTLRVSMRVMKRRSYWLSVDAVAENRMRCWAFVAVVFLLFATVAHPQDKGAPISIEYHGQSFFIMTTSKGTRIAFDPHTIPEYDRTEILPKVDVIC